MAAVDKDVCGHSWGDSPIIFTRDCVTCENYWRITPLVTTSIGINGSPYTIYIFFMVALLTLGQSYIAQ